MTKATIRFECPGCEKAISFAVADIGTVQECPHCGGYVDVPGEKDDHFGNDPDHERQRAQYGNRSRAIDWSFRILGNLRAFANVD